MQILVISYSGQFFVVVVVAVVCFLRYLFIFSDFRQFTLDLSENVYKK